MKLLFLMIFLVGCANVPEDVQNVAPVAIGGAVVAETAKKITQAFTPKYPLLVQPQEICDITQDPVKCWIVPCRTSCEVSIDRATFLANNPKVQTIQSSQIVSALKFCEKNTKACEKFLGEYDGFKIVLTEE